MQHHQAEGKRRPSASGDTQLEAVGHQIERQTTVRSSSFRKSGEWTGAPKYAAAALQTPQPLSPPTHTRACRPQEVYAAAVADLQTLESQKSVKVTAAVQCR
jgi:hypothetical protein